MLLHKIAFAQVLKFSELVDVLRFNLVRLTRRLCSANAVFDLKNLKLTSTTRKLTSHPFPASWILQARNRFNSRTASSKNVLGQQETEAWCPIFDERQARLYHPDDGRARGKSNRKEEPCTGRGFSKTKKVKNSNSNVKIRLGARRMRA